MSGRDSTIGDDRRRLGSGWRDKKCQGETPPSVMTEEGLVVDGETMERQDVSGSLSTLLVSPSTTKPSSVVDGETRSVRVESLPDTSCLSIHTKPSSGQESLHHR